ncbi:MAG TPA: type II secretion system protein GspG [Thermoanaerobaculia bacterium]
MIRGFLIVAGLFGVVSASNVEPPVKPVVPAKTGKPAVRTPPERAWDDLRWLMTALEAYSTDNDSHFAPAGGRREGQVSDLDKQLEWYYANTYPKRSAPPSVDPWGRAYRFVISDARTHYALYSLGADGKLNAAEAQFLERLKKDDVKDDELKEPHTSRNVIVTSGGVTFAPPEVLRGLQPVK